MRTDDGAELGAESGRGAEGLPGERAEGGEEGHAAGWEWRRERRDAQDGRDGMGRSPSYHDPPSHSLEPWVA